MSDEFFHIEIETPKFKDAYIKSLEKEVRFWSRASFLLAFSIPAILYMLL